LSFGYAKRKRAEDFDIARKCLNARESGILSQEATHFQGEEHRPNKFGSYLISW
jgi:hypothetical protein